MIINASDSPRNGAEAFLVLSENVSGGELESPSHSAIKHELMQFTTMTFISCLLVNCFNVSAAISVPLSFGHIQCENWSMSSLLVSLEHFAFD